MIIEFEYVSAGELKYKSIDIPDQIIKQAAELAYGEDKSQYIGRINDCWVIRSEEDPDAENLDHRVIVNASGDVTAA